ncbi:tetratricopeptide repeat protein [Yoonia sediminilitoris]|uniref:Tetratricopeptide repeat protein n=1 Tax=Yoonia sediminilitoris TaxID=1286148 RepID=A0A2T6KIP0_9RHOB|nr:tetratricopeptide repeat protein [Yoonia sediminilitoris]PUB15585.1 tetratricopeptide repeat protein [Yoonia sediminilitoris]RCW96194.1 tetratricopeptide repeat protein [Yoonia sediminilitoris]
MADPNPGAYLAARQANVANDFGSSAHYYTKSLLSDPTNAALLEKAMTSFMALGQLDRAIPVAQAMVEKGYQSQMANLALSAKAAKDGDWSDIFTALEQGRGVAPLVDGLSQAWAHLGEGDMKKALNSFDQLIETEGMAVYGMTHKAYALGLVGDFEGAEAVYLEAAAKGQLRYSANSAMAHAQILSQLDRNDDAVAVLDSVFGTQRGPKVEAMYQALRAGRNLPFDTVSSATEGLADIFFSVANAVKGEAPDNYTLLYTQAASYLDPDNSNSVILTAELLDNMKQFDLANEAYASVSRDDPAFHAAELGRAQVLFAAGRKDAAIEVLDALTRSHPDVPQVYATKGDTLRRAGRYADATPAYSRALELYDSSSPVTWFVHYTRGITYHKTDNWTAAEADFRAALDMRPDQPQVLNYLGYSLVERGEKLDEALDMIEKAAAAQPENGAIIDSLGWVLFQLGRYEEAVGYMESAAALLPVDPVINDHLGDVYWAVGRETEAQFQWQRALSFDPVEADADRIRDKLSRGLDLVLRDEGLDPIRMASGND